MNNPPPTPLMIDVTDLANGLVRIERARQRWSDLGQKLLGGGTALSITEEFELSNASAVHASEGGLVLRKLYDRVRAAQLANWPRRYEMIKISDAPEYDPANGCPKCGGTKGYSFIITQKIKMAGGWGESPQTADSGSNIHQGMVTCDDCACRFRVQTLNELGAIP